MVEKAIKFATKMHEGQVRKGTTRPYIEHPLEVGRLVSEMTSDEEIISAAYLHDTVEDCNVTVEELEELFSPRVAHLVAQESEDKKRSWQERKQGTIDRLRNEPMDVRLIAMADKLSNIRDIERDYPEEGEAFWNRFSMKSKECIGWYYKGLKESLREGLSDTKQYQEYKEICERIFGE